MRELNIGNVRKLQELATVVGIKFTIGISLFGIFLNIYKFQALEILRIRFSLVIEDGRTRRHNRLEDDKATQ